MMHRRQYRSLSVRSGCRAHWALWAVASAPGGIAVRHVAERVGAPVGQVELTCRALCDGGFARVVGWDGDDMVVGVTLLGRVAIANLHDPVAY